MSATAHRQWICGALVCALAACGGEGSSPGAGTGINPEPETPRSAPQAPPADGRPNIVLFSIDTLRPDHLGAYGYRLPTSPEIDAFSREGLRFERAISQAPTTAPAHMSIFTGVTPAVHGVNNLREAEADRLDPAFGTFVEGLRDQGYLTAGFHGGGNVDGAMGFSRGFHLYSSDFVSFNWMNAHRTTADLEAIRSWIRTGRARGAPVFLFLHHYACHAPYLSAPERYRREYLAGREVEGLPRGVPDAEKYRLLDLMERRSGGRARSRLHWHVFRTSHEAFWRGVDLAREDHRRHMIALYDAGVSFADFLFGEVMKILREEKIYDDTIVVLTSDHGEEFGEHGGKEHRQLFVETLRVPLVIRFPSGAGVEPGTVAATVRTMDILPSLFDHLGIEATFPHQGASFMPLLGAAGEYRPPVVSYPDRELSRVRIETPEGIYALERGAPGSEWLFDPAADPAEQRNLAAERADLLARLRAAASLTQRTDQLFGQRVRQRGAQQPTIDPELLEQIKALGYVR